MSFQESCFKFGDRKTVKQLFALITTVYYRIIFTCFYTG